MFVFVFERALLPFAANHPASAPLFQLPPRITSRCRRTPYRSVWSVARSVLSHPPTIRPSSEVCSLH